jgi:pyruvate,water dikinase
MFGLGSWRERKKKEEVLLTLKLRLNRWRHLLRAEEAFLDSLSDMGEKLSGEYLFDRQYLFSSLGYVFQKAYQVAYDTGILWDPREEARMYSWVDRLRERTTSFLKNWPLIREGPSVVPISEKCFCRPDQVGETASRLLEVLRKGGIPIPPGFVITIQGFLHLLDANHLGSCLQPDPSSKAAGWTERYQILSQALLEATIPEELKRTVYGALAVLGEDSEPFPSLILWASPLRSEGLPSFPSPARRWSGKSLDTLWDLLRSLWSQSYQDRALEKAPLPGRYPFLPAVVCQCRIPEGETYRVQTLDSTQPEGGNIVAQPLMDFLCPIPSNPAKPVEFRISRAWPHEEVDPGPGGESQAWSPEKRQRLTQLSLRVENHFKRAQEIIWKEDGSGNFSLIQLRFQDILPPAGSAAGEPLSLLLKEMPRYYDRQGKIVSRGIASGPVVSMSPGGDLSSFPEGGILMARDWSPDWRPLLPKISAILVEHQPPPSLAFLARSYRIPTISHLRGVMKKIPPQAVVTVDAEENLIYQNRVEPLLFSQLVEGPLLEDEPEYLLLDRILREVDPSYSWEGTGKSPQGLEGSRTLREGIQWARRQAMAFLFDEAVWRRLVRDRWAFPVTGEFKFSVYAIDLGGALSPSKPARGSPSPVHPTEINSAPWLFLWQGLNPLPGRTVPEPTEKSPLFLILSEDTLFLNRFSGGTKIILDATLAEIPEFNHFFWYQDLGEKGGRQAAVPGQDQSPIREIQLSRRSAAEVEERLNQAGRELDP